MANFPSTGARCRARFRLRLALVVATALALRLVYVISVQHDWVGGDGFAYSLSARRVAGGHGFLQALGPPRQDATHPPLWTLVLAIPHLLGRHSWLASQTLACFIGVATVALVGLATRQIAGDRAGLFAAAFAALYPGLWMFERELLSETLLVLGVAVAILCAYSFIARPSLRRALVLGVVCGLLALVRAEQALLLLVLVTPVVLSRNGVPARRRALWLGASIGAAVLVISPWTIYNAARFDHPVLLSDNLGVAMIAGNCDLVLSGKLLGYYDNKCLAEARKHVDVVGVDQSTSDQRLRRYAVHNIRAHLGRLPVVVAARLGRVWGFYRPFQTARLEARWTNTRLWVHQSAVVCYWALLAGAIVGIALLRRRGVPVYPLLAFVVTVIAVVAITLGETRFRAAADVPIVMLAAVAVDELRTKRSIPLT